MEASGVTPSLEQCDKGEAVHVLRRGARGAAARAPETTRATRGRKGGADLSIGRRQAQAKKCKAGDHAPAGADKEVYASLFTSSTVDARGEETFLSRNARKAW